MTDPSATTVYVVDDDAGMLESTQWLLESVGLRVEAYRDGRQFLDSVTDTGAGCVILDVRMPGLGGLNVQEELQKRGLAIPIIFVSGHADVPIVVRAFKSGAFDFLEKPFNEQLLLDSVQQALQRHPPSAHRPGDAPDLQARIEALTRRERDVFLPLAQGYTSREIADQLGVSVKTIDLYRARVMKRLGADRLPDVTGMAIAAGLLDPLALRENR
ncbi:response regulator [Marinobacter lutaoensis]|jgi:FixJ family two-component response regulator|uniref:DNA-binding response regulator n=1 Tax=Marinobacter lutaoensis TaxID=135739 RepID=A0A1V2DSN1_9GAMM|nr:response regulator [Marinobacter lutaoensis]MBI42219.1 DNA-binding response regulator [Oceanospirillales bacterium]NVD36425.1 response regulator transcription factor [Marinobacter lutaoensis]ONF43708.1 DNA-binding response regulator [Marinobacter lutaoensis]|tara:strand:+ start:3250 stop:3894 length:645 start_codon:yes stop_codon:yes gene_type:complete